MNNSIVRDLAISYSDSVLTSRPFSQKSIKWADLVERMKQSRTLPIVARLYQRAKKKGTKEDKKQILNWKNSAGCFLLGSLRDGERKQCNITARSGICIDLDDIRDRSDCRNVLDEVRKFCADRGCAAIIHSTASHQEDVPRIRIIIPFSHDISALEYVAIAKLISDRAVGCQTHPDSKMYNPAQVAFCPAHCEDVKPFWEVIEGGMLDPDPFLAEGQQSGKVQTDEAVVKKECAEDPRSKPGIIGAFCRAYGDIESGLDELLPNVYERAESRPGFWHLIASDSAPGVMILQSGQHLISFHSNHDPCADGHAHNLFDVVRLHRYGHLDKQPAYNQSPDDVYPDPTKRPSFKAMIEYCHNDPKVQKALCEEDFTDGGDLAASLARDKSGELKPSLKNMILILRKDPALKGLRLDKFSGLKVFTAPMPWHKHFKGLARSWVNGDAACFQAYLVDRYHCSNPGLRGCLEAVECVAQERSFNSLVDYLNAQKWDGQKRIDTLLCDYLGADNNLYVRGVSRKTLIAAVARAYDPGCKVDNVLVLTGAQGVGKSTLFRRLAGDGYFTDCLSLNDMTDGKRGAEQIKGAWIVEIAEMAGQRKAEQEAVKAFITRQADQFRPAYGRDVETAPRHCILVGTCNSDAFLQDLTGNRRFWPVAVKGAGFDLRECDLPRDQIWAEAVTAYKNGESWTLDKDAESEAEVVRDQALSVPDGLLDCIASYLDIPLPDTWYNGKTQEKRCRYIELMRNGGPGVTAKTMIRQHVGINEIITEGLTGTPFEGARREEIQRTLKRLRWTRVQGAGSRVRSIYGQERAYWRPGAVPGAAEDFLLS